MSQHGLSGAQLDTIRSLILKHAPGTERVALFGSRAAGRHAPHSDIDLVLYGDVDEQAVDRLWTAFHESYLPYKTDVSAYNLIAYPPMIQHIDEHAKTLFDKDDLQPLGAER